MKSKNIFQEVIHTLILLMFAFGFTLMMALDVALG